MPGLEDLAGAALAQPFQQDVRPVAQVSSPAGKHEIDLKGGQPAALQHGLGQCLGRHARCGRCDVMASSWAGATELVPAENAHQVGHRVDGHWDNQERWEPGRAPW